MSSTTTGHSPCTCGPFVGHKRWNALIGGMMVDGDCSLDLGAARCVFPPGAVAALALAEYRAAAGLATTVTVPRSADVLTYLGRIDFFKLLPEGVSVDGEIAHLDGHARHSSGTFTELVRVTPDGIEQLMDILGRFLQQHAPSLFRKTYSAVEELLSNIGRHASVGLGAPAYACGQVQVYANRIELAFADLGVGYLRSLRCNPDHAHFQTSEAALRGIIQRGLSRHHRPEETHGGGLRTVAQTAHALGGELRIITSDGQMWEQNRRRSYSTTGTSFPGTLAAAVFPIGMGG